MQNHDQKLQEEINDMLETEGETEQRINDYIKIIESNPFDYNAYIYLTKIYRENGHLDELRMTRERFSFIYVLPITFWIDWIKDEMRIAESEITDELQSIDKDQSIPNSVTSILNLFDRAVHDFMSIDVWLDYVQYVIGQMGPLGLSRVRDTFENAIANCGLHVTQGSIVWEAYREFEMALIASYENRLESIREELTLEEPALDTNETELALKPLKDECINQYMRVFSLFKRQLSIPLQSMEETVKEFRDWIQTIDHRHKTLGINSSGGDTKILTFMDPKEIDIIEKQLYPSAFSKLTEISPFETAIENAHQAIIAHQNSENNLSRDEMKEHKDMLNNLRFNERQCYVAYINHEMQKCFGSTQSGGQDTKSRKTENSSSFNTTPSRIICLYERALCEMSNDPELWIAYARLYIDKLRDITRAQSILARAVRCFIGKAVVAYGYTIPIDNTTLLEAPIDMGQNDIKQFDKKDVLNSIAKLWIGLLECFERIHLETTTFFHKNNGSQKQHNIEMDSVNNEWGEYNGQQNPSSLPKDSIQNNHLPHKIPNDELNNEKTTHLSKESALLQSIKKFKIPDLIDATDIYNWLKKYHQSSLNINTGSLSQCDEYVRYAESWLGLALKYVNLLPYILRYFSQQNGAIINIDQYNRLENLVSHHSISKRQREFLTDSLKCALTLWMTYLGFIKRLIDRFTTNSGMDVNIEAIKALFCQRLCDALTFIQSPMYRDALNQSRAFDDTLFTLLEYKAKMLAHPVFNNMKESRNAWETIIKQGGSYSSTVWLEWYYTECMASNSITHSTNDSKKDARKILIRALSNSNVERLEPLIDALRWHDRIYYCDIDNDNKLSWWDLQNDTETLCANVLKRHTQKRKQMENESVESKSKKRKGETNRFEPTRDTNVSKRPSKKETSREFDQNKIDNDGFIIPAIPKSVSNESKFSTTRNINQEKEMEFMEQTPQPSSFSLYNSGQNVDFSLVPDRTLFLSNLSFKATEKDIGDLFSQFGEISHISLVKTRKTLHSRGYAYLLFNNAQSAQKALANDRILLLERPVFISEYGIKGHAQTLKTTDSGVKRDFIKESIQKPYVSKSKLRVTSQNADNLSQEVDGKDTSPQNQFDNKESLKTKRVVSHKKDKDLIASKMEHPKKRLDIGKVTSFLPRQLKSLHVTSSMENSDNHVVHSKKLLHEPMSQDVVLPEYDEIHKEPGN